MPIRFLHERRPSKKSINLNQKLFFAAKTISATASRILTIKRTSVPKQLAKIRESKKSGGASTDTLYANNMRLAALEPEIREQIKGILPDFAMISNPVDCSFSMTPDQVKRLIELGREGRMSTASLWSCRVRCWAVFLMS
jgi:acyl-CoA synthetase (NDP forming)